MASKVDNGVLRWKQAMRIAALSGAPTTLRVLEPFCGEGGLYRGVWSRYGAGACMDKVPEKVERAAEERQGWACYCGDSIKALSAGWAGAVPWDVVDLDVYGSPWPALRAWMTSDRARAPRTHLFMTDGYMRQASLVKPCRALFPGVHDRRAVSPEAYRSTVRDRLAEWGAEQQLSVVLHKTHKARRLRLHHLIVEGRT